MKPIRIAAVTLIALLAACSFEVQQPRGESSGRYQLVAGEGQTAILLDTATGESWYMADGREWKRCAGGPEGSYRDRQ